jgi:hypothetical protein
LSWSRWMSTLLTNGCDRCGSLMSRGKGEAVLGNLMLACDRGTTGLTTDTVTVYQRCASTEYDLKVNPGAGAAVKELALRLTVGGHLKLGTGNGVGPVLQTTRYCTTQGNGSWAGGRRHDAVTAQRAPCDSLGEAYTEGERDNVSQSSGQCVTLTASASRDDITTRRRLGSRRESILLRVTVSSNEEEDLRSIGNEV